MIRNVLRQSLTTVVFPLLWVSLFSLPLHAQSTYTIKLSSMAQGKLQLQACLPQVRARGKATGGDSLVISLAMARRDSLNSGADSATPRSKNSVATGTLGDSASAGLAGGFLVAYLDKIPLTLSADSEGALLASAPAGTLAGQLLELTTIDLSYVCSVVLGPKKGAPYGEDFDLLAGVELSNAQGNFDQADTRVAATATWSHPWYNRSRKARWSATAAVELTSALTVDFADACRKGQLVTSVIDTLRPYFLRTSCGSADRHLDTLRFTIPDPTRLVFGTGKSARVTGQLSWEQRLGAEPLFAGLALQAGFQTNPSTPESPNVGMLVMLGPTITRVDSVERRTTFRLDLLFGLMRNFANPRTTKVTVPPIPGDSLLTRYSVVVATKQTDKVLQVHLLSEPLRSFFIRGVAMISLRGERNDLVQLAFLKSFDLGRLFGAVLGS